MRPEGRTTLWILSALGAILLAASLSWFFSNFERRSREIDVGYSADARRNPFLAAERFLKRLDVPVEGRAGRDLLRDLPPPEDSLVIRGLGALNGERREALHQWIERGGRIIVGAVNPWDESDLPGRRKDDFLDRYGIRLLERRDPEEDQEPNPQLIAEINVEDYPHPLKVAFAANYYLEDGSGEASTRVAAGDLPRLLQLEIGAGMLTVVSDSRFVENRHIGDHDHALFLALLASPADGGKVWLLYDSGMPWLGELLWRRAPHALVSSLCLLLLLPWYLGRRLGPFEPSPVSGRRDLLAQLQAGAGFLWHHGYGNRLAERSRERVERTWLRRHPALRELGQAERAAWIARRAGIAAGDVERSLYSPATTESDLVASADLLQRLSFQGHGSRTTREIAARTRSEPKGGSE